MVSAVEHPSQSKAIESIAEKLDIHRDTLRVWLRRAEVDEGRRPGLTTDEPEPVLLRELRRAGF